MPDRISWDAAKALDEANKKAARDVKRDTLLLAIGEMTVRSNDLSCDLCLHCMSEGSDEDPHDWDCPQPLIDRFHDEGFELPAITTPTGD